jgi:hypothetical protein
MEARHSRLSAVAVAGLTVLLLAACSTTRLNQTGSTTTASGTGATAISVTSGQTGACTAEQISIPGGPPYSPTTGGSTSTSGGATTATTVADGDSEPLLGSSIVPLNGTWIATDDSQTCGCAVTLTETQVNMAGNASPRGCQSSWLRQLAYFEYRNGGNSIAFFGGTRDTVLFELQRNGTNLMAGFAFGQRITIFRGS